MAIKTVIIDDQPENILMLEEAINEIFDVEIIATFASGEEFFKVAKKLTLYFQQENCDLIIALTHMRNYNDM